MSISTQSPMNPEFLKKLEELQGKPAVSDATTALYDQLCAMTSKQGGDLARAQGEPVSVELNEIGDIRTLADGSRYQVTPHGWKKLKDETTSDKT